MRTLLFKLIFVVGICVGLIIYPPFLMAAEVGTTQALGVNLYHTGITQAQGLLIERALAKRQFKTSIDILENELKKDPTNTTLLYKKAAIYSDMEQYDAALDVLNKIAILHPDNAEANHLRKLVEYKKCQEPRNELGFGQDEAYVSDLRAYWSYSSLHYYRFSDLGTFGARVNSANRFGTSAKQYQLEGNPKLFKGAYLNFIAAYANDSQTLYPQWQYTIEPYFTLPENFELSIGQRFLVYQGAKIYTYTGSIGRYFGNYFIWFREYHYTPKSTDYFELAARRYFSDKNTYISLRVGTGKYPDIGSIVPFSQIIQVQANSIRVDGQLPLTKSVFLRGGAGYVRQTFLSGKVREITDAGLGLVWQF